MDLISLNRGIRPELQSKKYAHVLADEFSIAPELAADQQRLWADWNHLDLDNYLKDGSRFRYRAFAYMYFLPSSKEILAYPPMPFVQPSEHNAYATDTQREFSPLPDASLTNPFLHEMILFNFQQFQVPAEKLCQPWKLDIHQIRIVASPDEDGHPSPEGIHRDESDFFAIHLVNWSNVAGGVNRVYDNNRNPIAITLYFIQIFFALTGHVIDPAFLKPFT